MGWLGPMLHLIYSPRRDQVSREFERLLETRHGHLGQLTDSRIALQALARVDPLDDLAERR